MSRGGRRAGTPGTNYQNRSDLRAVPSPEPVGHSSQYGEGERLRRAVKMVPPAGAATPAGAGTVPAQPSAGPSAPAAAPGPPTPPPVGPGELGDLLGETDRPAEHPDTPYMTTANTVSQQLETLAGTDPTGEIAALVQFTRNRGM